MKNKLVLLSCFILSISLIFFVLFNLQRAKAASLNLKEFSSQFLDENEYFTSLFDSFNFKLNKGLIEIHTEVTDDFIKLNSDKQYGFLAYFAKYLRYHLRNEMESPILRTTNINIICDTKDQNYKLSNIVPNKKVRVISESSLYINNELILSSKEYKIRIEQFLHNNPDLTFVDNDIEIIRYAVQMFNKITVGGKYYNHKRDSKVILDLVTEKFGITEDEYSNIYKKYFFIF